MRPRDVIDFVNCCLPQAEGKVSVTKEAILTAEREYAQNRMQALGE